MIHSLAGGVIKDLGIYDFAKVEFVEGENVGSIGWYINPFIQLKVDDIVLVPVGMSVKLVRAKVIKIERNVSEQDAPLSAKRAKEIFKIVKQ